MTARGANRRIRLLLLVLVALFSATLLRAFWLQGVRAASLSKLGVQQHREVVTIPARPGDDLRPHRCPARHRRAGDDRVREPAPDPRSSVGRGRGGACAAARSQPDLGLLADRTRGFVYVQRKADAGRAAVLRRLKIPGIGFYPEERRIYPQGSVAAQVLGYAGVDNRGLGGVELGLDGLLTGRQGRETIVKDPFGRPIDILSSVDERKGTDVFLTIDRTLQANVERILRETVGRWRARTAAAIVLDPHSGGVIAMGVAPGFNANGFPRTPPAVQRNRAVTDTYEPGSTFKLVTAAAVLSEHVVSPRTRFFLQPRIRVADRWIHDSHPRGAEEMSVADIFARSSNVGTVTLARLLGETRLARWISRFGFGHRTGIDFPGKAQASRCRSRAGRARRSAPSRSARASP